MPEPYVTIERNGPLALVRFDRKKNLNAFDSQLILELTDVARSFHDDLGTRAVVLTGSTDYFSAGADLEDLASRNDPALSDLESRQIFYRGGGSQSSTDNGNFLGAACRKASRRRDECTTLSLQPNDTFGHHKPMGEHDFQ